MYRKTPPIKTEVIIEGSPHIQKKKKTMEAIDIGINKRVHHTILEQIKGEQTESYSKRSISIK